MAVGVLLTGCREASAPRDAAVSARATPVAVSTAAAPTTGALHGDVSPLSGSVTGFAVRVTDLSTIVALDADVLFDFDEATLRPDATAQLGKTADLIRQGGEGVIGIDGFTDAKGSDAYNLDLSRRRAETVAAWMRKQVGVRQRSFAVVGKGEADPVAPNAKPDGTDDPAGRAKNRRVEIVIPKGR